LFVAAPLAFTLIVGTGVIARSHRNTDGGPKTVYWWRRRGSAQRGARKSEAREPAPRAEEPKVPPRAERSQELARGEGRCRSPEAGAAIHAAKANPAEAAPKAQEAGALPNPRESEIVATAPVSSTREATLNIVALPWAEVSSTGPGRGSLLRCEPSSSGPASIG